MAIEIQESLSCGSVLFFDQGQELLRFGINEERFFYNASWKSEMTPFQAQLIFAKHIKSLRTRDGEKGFKFVLPNNLDSNIDDQGVSTIVRGGVNCYAFHFIASRFGDTGEVVIPGRVNFFGTRNDPEELLRLYRDTTLKPMEDNK